MTSQIKYRSDYRSPDFTITEIDLTINLAEEQTQIIACSTVKRLAQEAPSLFLNGEALELLAVEIDGQPWVDYEQVDEGLLLNNVPDQFTLTIKNTISPLKNTALSGLYVSGEAMCTQCEAEGFRRITYFLDRPDVLARFTTRLTADKKRYPYLLANGNLIEQIERENGEHSVVWHDPYPKPCYLFALVAGDFDRLQDEYTTCSGRRVKLELFVDRGNLTRSHWAMQSLKAAMQWDETRFGLEYDLDIYMIVAVDFFNMGAMENKGLNIFNSKFVLASEASATDKDYAAIESVIGHEYFHNWTGNRITCRDWFQLSLKEGLTVFRDQEFSADLGSRAVNRIEQVRLLRAAQFAEDASPMAHPIRPEQVLEMDNFYTLTVYEKGAEVIRMLHTLLGEEAFQQGMQLYVKRFDGQAVTCDDFVQAMQDASGIDLNLFKRWYSQSGTPLLTVSDVYHAETQQYELTLAQHTPVTLDQSTKQALLIPITIALYNAAGEEIKLIAEGQEVNPTLQLTELTRTFIFEQVKEKPVLGLLAHFSAPVKLNYAYSDAALLFLLQHAKDAFIRWDAMQMLCNREIVRNVINYQQQQDLVLSAHLKQAFEYLLQQRSEPHLLAQLLEFPSEVELAEWFDSIDVKAIATARNFTVQALAQLFAVEFLAIYHRAQTNEIHFNHAAMAQRALQGVALSYLALQSDNKGSELVQQHYQQAKNMSDTLNALQAANVGNLTCRTALMQDFEIKWQHDGLVMDKWFVLQATQPCDSVLTQVKALLKHSSFSLLNPNRVRALVGGFCRYNPSAFHANDGSGYQFLEEILSYLNQHNPKVASRLIDPLLCFKRYNKEQQSLMQQTLRKLQTLPNLSADLREKLDKALQD